MEYKIPVDRYYRLHHVRSRFKNDVESVLLYVADQIALLGDLDKELFNEKLNTAIKLYPGNYRRTEKTVNNWRTEITSLFGFIQQGSHKLKPGKIAVILSEKQDLIEFFRYFLYYFQYPGGHLKPNETLDMIKAGIKFNPTRYLLSVLMEGRTLVPNGKKFGITKAEATACIFNDLSVTRYNRPAIETVKLLIKNDENDISYTNDGDTVRYAGDILDYMVLADLVTLRPNYKYYPNTHNFEVISSFINNKEYFHGYEKFYDNRNLSLNDINLTQKLWFDYVNQDLNNELFSADIHSILENYKDIAQTQGNKSFIDEMLDKIERNKQAISTKEIGDVGEALTIEHEKNRISNLGRVDLIHLIKKIPEAIAAGYDIKSFLGHEDDFRFIHIEVKTTISKNRLTTQSFHMSPNEWRAADSYKESYFIYRILISSNDIGLFIIRDPVSAYKDNRLQMTPTNGADIRYTGGSGRWEPLLA